MISTYIKSLIDVHSRVIVPDLGAFMLKGDSTKTIYFNEFLRFNDGLLVDYIAEQEKIDKIEAIKKVKAFVDNVNKQLNDGKSIELEGLGTLYLDLNEKIQLKINDTNVSQDSNPTKPEVEPTPREILFELEKTDPSSDQTKTLETEHSASNARPTSTTKPKTESVINTSQKEVKTSATSQFKTDEATVPIVKEKKVHPPSPAPDSNKDVIDVVPTTTRRMVIVGIFGVLVIAAIIYFAFLRLPEKNSNANQNITIGDDSTINKNDSIAKTKSPESPNKTKMAGQPNAVKHRDVAKTDPQTKVTANIKSKVTSVKTSKSENPKSTLTAAAGKRFYVIAGTFSVESNADKFFKRLKEQGYQSDKILNEAKNVYYISFSSFAEKSSALEEIKKLKASGTEAWIFTK